MHKHVVTPSQTWDIKPIRALVTTIRRVHKCPTYPHFPAVAGFFQIFISDGLFYRVYLLLIWSRHENAWNISHLTLNNQQSINLTVKLIFKKIRQYIFYIYCTFITRLSTINSKILKNTELHGKFKTARFN